MSTPLICKEVKKISQISEHRHIIKLKGKNHFHNFLNFPINLTTNDAHSLKKAKYATAWYDKSTNYIEVSEAKRKACKGKYLINLTHDEHDELKNDPKELRTINDGLIREMDEEVESKIASSS